MSVVATSVSGVMAFLALGLSVYNYVVGNRRERDRDDFQNRMTEEAVETQKQILDIEAWRHEWNSRSGNWFVSRNRKPRQEQPPPISRFVPRIETSPHTWARVISTSEGPALARDVSLDVWYQMDYERHEIQTLRGQDHREAELLAPNEGVHIAVFSLASPPSHTLRFRVDWTDDRGAQHKEDQVPLL